MDCINVLTRDGHKIKIQISPLGIDGLLQTDSNITILPSFWNKRKRDSADLPYPLLFSNGKNEPFNFVLLGLVYHQIHDIINVGILSISLELRALKGWFLERLHAHYLMLRLHRICY